ncbi:hypothetical protein DFH08DRAFT_958420 [Mycena albidolilacea]|uniref:Uncharacterized protein n=1 Tax=Mycena albidolilacea TaxID=1033008 RepID=A0AAD7EV40_9AGAR|nr:hypothetical protein DFH08DRAFT_958420 [Mycena albidolilacea]
MPYVRYLRVINAHIQAKVLAAGITTLTTSNAAIGLETLLARSATVRSSNGRITGIYAVDDSLDIRTSNGYINVVASINNATGGSNSEAASFYDLALTMIAELSGAEAILPVNLALDVSVLTRKRTGRDVSKCNINGKTCTITYEGTFELSTSKAGVLVDHLNLKERDPACGADAEGKGRNRSLHMTNVSKRSAAGSVFWDKKNANRGKVSNNPVTLHV